MKKSGCFLKKSERWPSGSEAYPWQVGFCTAVLPLNVDQGSVPAEHRAGEGRRGGAGSFDDLIGAEQERRRDCEAERLGGRHVDHRTIHVSSRPAAS